jgi:uncharacterized protein (DUF305 family)
MRRAARLLAGSLLALGLLAGCGDDAAEDATGDQTVEVPESEDVNGADVAFATDMIPHHAQGLSMVDLTLGRDVSPELLELSEQIRDTQSAEIEQMADWLQEWGQPVPETSRDHMNAEGHGDDEGTDEHHDLPGMMDDEAMEELADAGGAGFEEMWLQMMVEHHEGAIEMAETEIAEGELPDAVAMAEGIVETQQAEIEQMESMLG